MHYTDALYGEIEVDEPALCELMACDAMVRIRQVHQHGITALLGISAPFSRFDHSVGTMMLVRRMGAGLKEQIAALLHDVSHTAFSHVIDYVFDHHGERSYHERKMEDVVARSGIPAILQRHRMDWRDFLDDARFPLLEQPAPALCADRLDYFLRDLVFLGLAGEIEIHAVLDSLVVTGGRMAMRDLDVARWLAYTYIEADHANWSDFREVGLYQVTAEAIKSALQFGLITEADFWDSDDSLWDKLLKAEHPEVKRWVGLISPGTRFTWDAAKPVFRISPRIRWIDPLVLYGGTQTTLSMLDAGFARRRDEYLAGKQGHWPMGIVSIAGVWPS